MLHALYYSERGGTDKNIIKNDTGGGVTEIPAKDTDLFIDYRNMDLYTSDPLEWRCVDRVKVKSGKYAVGEKAVSSLDWFVPLHYPGCPVMPGGMIMESIMQTAVFVVTASRDGGSPLMLFHACRFMEMEKAVRPGDLLKVSAALKSYRGGVAVFHGEAFVDSFRICAMEFTLIKPAELQKLSPVKR